MIVSKPDRGTPITPADLASQAYQVFFDDLERELNTNLLGNQVQLKSYTIAALPVVTTAAGLIYVSDETGGAVPCFSDGTNWRRVTDRAIAS